MPLKNPRHEAFAQALARGMSASAAYGQAGFKPHRANAATLARKEHISVRVTELQEEQLAIHQQATAAAAANKQITIESLIAEAEAARAKAMSEKGGAAAAVSALTAPGTHRCNGDWPYGRSSRRRAMSTEDNIAIAAVRREFTEALAEVLAGCLSRAPWSGGASTCRHQKAPRLPQRPPTSR